MTKKNKDKQRPTKHTHKTKDKTAYSEGCCPISQYNFTTLHMIGLSEMNKSLPQWCSIFWPGRPVDLATKLWVCIGSVCLKLYVCSIFLMVMH
jgi:hypothetical protein